MSQQLVKKGANGKHENVMPRSWIEAIKDKNTGQTLVEILQGFNMYFLPYNGNTSSTRCLVPTMLRKKGLWITYVKYDGNVYTEWYAASEIDDKSWGDSSNWRIGNNTLVGDITISANGNWVINGTETEFKAIGEKGNTPLIRVANNRLQVSYDLGDTYIDVTNNPVYTKFRWLATTGDTQANNVGRIQASVDEGKTWTNMSNDFANNLHISRYIGLNESLPTSGIAEGTIYAKGPTYADGDTSHTNPIYRLWVYAWKNNTLAWQDNGEFTSIVAGVVQETGDSETEVMSQKAVTDKLSKLGPEVDRNAILLNGYKENIDKPGCYNSKGTYTLDGTHICIATNEGDVLYARRTLPVFYVKSYRPGSNADFSDVEGYTERIVLSDSTSVTPSDAKYIVITKAIETSEYLSKNTITINGVDFFKGNIQTLKEEDDKINGILEKGQDSIDKNNTYISDVNSALVMSNGINPTTCKTGFITSTSKWNKTSGKHLALKIKEGDVFSSIRTLPISFLKTYNILDEGSSPDFSDIEGYTERILLKNDEIKVPSDAKYAIINTESDTADYISRNSITWNGVDISYKDNKSLEVVDNYEMVGNFIYHKKVSKCLVLSELGNLPRYRYVFHDNFNRADNAEDIGFNGLSINKYSYKTLMSDDVDFNVGISGNNAINDVGTKGTIIKYTESVVSNYNCKVERGNGTFVGVAYNIQDINNYSYCLLSSSQCVLYDVVNGTHDIYKQYAYGGKSVEIRNYDSTISLYIDDVYVESYNILVNSNIGMIFNATEHFAYKSFNVYQVDQNYFNLGLDNHIESSGSLNTALFKGSVSKGEGKIIIQDEITNGSNYAIRSFLKYDSSDISYSEKTKADVVITDRGRRSKQIDRADLSTYIVGFDFYLPSQYWAKDYGEDLLFQIHAPSNADNSGVTPPIALRIKNDMMFFRLVSRAVPGGALSERIFPICRLSDNVDEEYKSLPLLSKDAWHSFYMYAKEGYEEAQKPRTIVYFDDELKVDTYIPNAMNSVTRTYLELGIYKSIWGSQPTDVSERMAYYDNILYMS